MGASPKQGVYRTLVDQLTSVPLSALTIVGSALAFSFNLGFFSTVGTSFLSLFTVQEHIVFSFSGAFVVFTLLAILMNVFSVVEYLHRQPVWSGPWIVNGLVFVALFDFIVITQVKDQFDRYGAREAILLFIIIAEASLAVRFYFHAVRDDDERKKVFLIAITVVALSFLSGMLYANEQIDGEKGSRRSRATMKSDQKEYGLVRAGQLYTLIVSQDGVVHAVRTDDLIEMSWGVACSACR